MYSLTRLLRPLEVLLPWVGGRSYFEQVCEAACPGSHMAAILSATSPVAHLWWRRGENGCDRADAVYVGCHRDVPGRLCRLLDRKRRDDYPVRSAQTRLSAGVEDNLDDLLASGPLPRRHA